jgi:hypothetical protein
MVFSSIDACTSIEHSLWSIQTSLMVNLKFKYALKYWYFFIVLGWPGGGMARSAVLDIIITF